MNFVKKRLLPALLFGTIILSLFLMITILGTRIDNVGFAFRIISILVFVSFMSLVFWELTSAFKLQWWIKLVLYFIILALYFAPFNTTSFWFDKPTSENILTGMNIPNRFSKELVSNIFVSYQTYILVFSIFVITFIVLYLNTKAINKEIVFFKIFYDAFLISVSLFVITIATRTIHYLCIFDYRYFTFIFIIAIISDVGGYAGGSLLGRKIIKQSFSPKISPSKSWEGAIFAYLFGLATASAFIFAFPLFDFSNANNTLRYVSISLTLIFIPATPIIGDLYFSMIKRLANIKDYSNILKEHGGFLDRYDSVSFTSVFVALIFLII